MIQMEKNITFRIHSEARKEDWMNGVQNSHSFNLESYNNHEILSLV